MGRYISSGSAQTGTNACSTITNSSCYQVACQKYAYDANSCWQNRVIVDSPGSYSFTVPAGVTCIRTVAVGGGGKPKCTETCCGYAGGGGAYAESYNTIAAGCTVTVVVGRQEQDTTITYVCSGGGTRTLTAGGAAGCTPGTASGGNWNSTGGCGGKGCNYCGGSLSHYCGTCICLCSTNCCGYCIVYAGVGVDIAPSHGADQCCNARYPGGGSAGWWGHCCGGNGQAAENSVDVYGASGGHGATAGGGGGVGYTTRQSRRSGPCSCMCGSANQAGQGGPHQRNACFPNNAGGGGGTKWQCCTCCECQGIAGGCTCGFWIEGHGGWGGYDNHTGVGGCMDWDCIGFYCGNYASCNMHTPPSREPISHPWHDIHSMCGSGSAGRSHHRDNDQWCAAIIWATREDQTPRPGNAGEGAGTGGVVFVCCTIGHHYTCYNQFVNWEFLCCLGVTNRVCCSDKFAQSLFPNIISCAGTLGGSGGVGICCMTSKAGKGGGGGVNRTWIMCVCHGGSYNCYNSSGAVLAYPPCDLDWRVSNAGTGMAIIYWKNS